MKKEIAEHLNRADEFVGAAEVLLANNMPAIALGRAYYAMFHAPTAALLARGVERRSHHALIAAFGQYFVKPGLVEKRYHSYLRDAFVARVDGDYGSLAVADPEKVAVHVEQARRFTEVCRNLCEQV
ncbi:HEPN domain-containing protein [Candidatus Sumerlaeota bacterium]|nr:HEPN domain-containing protein [Candidatus Sumerlaeota bacterium]